MVHLPTTCSAAPLATRTFLVSELTRAAQLLADLTTRHPSWTQARVRAVVARELHVSTVQLRYMLRKAVT